MYTTLLSRRHKRWNYFTGPPLTISLFNPIWGFNGAPPRPKYSAPLALSPHLSRQLVSGTRCPTNERAWPVFTVEKWTAGLHVNNICPGEATGSTGHRSRADPIQHQQQHRKRAQLTQPQRLDDFLVQELKIVNKFSILTSSNSWLVEVWLECTPAYFKWTIAPTTGRTQTIFTKTCL